MWKISTDSITGMMKFRLEDDDGDAVAAFRLNPADVRMLKGLEAACAEAQAMAENAPTVATAAESEEYNDKIENLICSGLGVKHDSVFGVIPGTTIMPDGDLFATNVLSTVADAMTPEILKRKAQMQKVAAKYTAKYT